MASLRSRFLKQLPEVDADPPASPMQSTVSDGSEESDDEPSDSSYAQQLNYGMERLAVSDPNEDVVSTMCCQLRTHLISF